MPAKVYPILPSEGTYNPGGGSHTVRRAVRLTPPFVKRPLRKWEFSIIPLLRREREISSSKKGEPGIALLTHPHSLH